MRILLFIFTLIFNIGTSLSQDTTLGFPPLSDSLAPVQNSLVFGASAGKVSVYKDERLDKISEFVRSGEGTVEGVKIDGFRVVIFFDMSKTAAEQQKASFLSMYPSEKAYIDYMAPNYRVRVGNYRTRLEAEKLKQEILPLFPTAIVVEDKIQLPTLN